VWLASFPVALSASTFGAVSRAQTSGPSAAASSPVAAAPVPAQPAVVAAPGQLTAPAPAVEPAEPFAFGDFTWMNGNYRGHKAVLESPHVTPELLVDINYTSSMAHPIDNTVVGSTAISRDDEVTLAFVGFGGDFEYDNVRGRLLTQFGVRSSLVPRNDGSAMRGQFDLDTALRYISEAYGGYHWDALHGINIDAGIFMSYVGLFSFDNFENWMYLPSFTSDNTPWFFNGIRLQIFTSDRFKIEPWIINGWQTYGKFNELPGFGAQAQWRPVEWFSLISNNYLGWDTADTPGRTRFHSDNSVLGRYYNRPDSWWFPKAAFSITVDFGGEQGDGVTPFSGQTGHNDPRFPANCTNANPCQQEFASWMAYNRLWFFDNILAWNVGGGMMHNPGRYLVLGPTGQASPFIQNLSTDGVKYVPASNPFSLNPGSSFDAWDIETGFQYMPNEQITYDLEINHREASVPFFAGHGGVTAPDGFISTAVQTGWKADLVKADNRVIAAMLVRF
jgi:hypothetical protein